jgi:hypothetical protein
MHSAQDLGWYASHSAVTSPAGLSSLLRDLPACVAELRQVAHGLVIHYRDDHPLKAGVPKDRLAEIETRYGERMLALAIILRRSVLDRGAHHD